MSSQIFDLSYPLNSEVPVYPGDSGIEIEIMQTAREPTPRAQRQLNCGRISLGLHNGTHIDAPFHFFSDQATIDSIPLDHCFGPTVWLDLSTTTTPGVIDASDLDKFANKLPGKNKVLLYTGWDQHWGMSDYFTEHPVLTAEGAKLLVSWEIDLVGVDFPSVDRPPFDAHLVLLGNNILIVENLTGIRALGEGNFDFFAIPLGIVGRDASPVRAFAMKN